MLCICLPHNTKLDTSCIFSQAGIPRRVNCLAPLSKNNGVKCLPQRRNVILPISGTEPRVDNLAVTNLRSYPLSCTSAKVGILKLSVCPKGTTARYIQCEHQTCNLLITIRCSYRLSYAAAEVSIIGVYSVVTLIIR